MLMTIEEFCESIEIELSEMVDKLTELTGRNSPEERKVWGKSLIPLSRALASATSRQSSLGNAHVYIGNVALEYRLPGASSWCDAVLLGQGNDDRPKAVIVELKHWDTKKDSHGPEPALINHHGRLELHPAAQVEGYTEYCRRFHSEVLEQNAGVNGCVFFTRETPLHEYKVNPHRQLCTNYPLFNIANEGDQDFGAYLESQISGDNEEFAQRFVEGEYKQDRNILVQVARALKETGERPFQLIDNQLEGFHKVLHNLKKVDKKSGERHIIVVKGPPGSGKSALAVNLWIESALQYNEKGNIVFVTTSSSQKTNWKHIFDKCGMHNAGGNMILSANQFNQKLSMHRVGQLKKAGYKMDKENWIENVEIHRRESGQLGLSSVKHFLSIVDEAHALINPVGHKMSFTYGWATAAGPQAYHIMNDSAISIFLLDSEQSFRDVETTTISDLEEYANILNASFEAIDLGDAQFRCAGSKEYVEWVEHYLQLGPPPAGASWCEDLPGRPGFKFEVVNSPFTLDEKLKTLHENGYRCRLLSSFAVPWISSGETDPHDKKKVQRDFELQIIDDDGEKRVWRRLWNYIPKKRNVKDYTMFIQGSEESKLAIDPTAEVGCPYTVRGFDFDYLGILWLEDLVWRDGEWVYQLDHVHETAFNMVKADAKKGRNNGPERLLNRIKRAYRILLTRALKGVYIYIHDEETRDHLIEELTKYRGDIDASQRIQ